MSADRQKIKLTFKSGAKKNTANAPAQSNVPPKTQSAAPEASSRADRLSRVSTPLEAARKNMEIYSSLGIESNDARRQALRSRRLKARRTVALSPAPVPVTASKSVFSRFLKDLKNGVTAHIKKLDLLLLAVIILLAVIGILAVHSASLTMASHRRMDILQIGGFIIGMLAVVILPFFDYSEILKHSKAIFILNVIILVYTAIFGFNPSGDSNRSWISLGFTNIQPAEFSKILFILTLSAHLEKVRDTVNKPLTLLGLLCHGGAIIGLVLTEQDWGNALVFIAIFAIMLFAAKLDIRYILSLIGLGVISFPFIWEQLGEFRRRRVLIGFNPDLDPLNYGFQAIRSRNAIASGGLFGQGYMQGQTVQHPTALAEKQNDMIFAVIGQEFGFIGCILVIVAFALLIYRILRTAGKSKDYAGLYLCAGIAGLILFQFIINIGMALGITPVVGITLPLVSYGTSSLLSVYFALALVMTVRANAYEKL